MEEKKEKRVQIAFDIAAEIHAYIKSNAALRMISINKWMMIALSKEIERLKQYD